MKVTVTQQDGRKKIYLAGPMSGYKEQNFPAFDYAKSRLKDKWTVISPADMDRSIGFDPTKGDILNLEEVEYRHFIDDCIRRDVEVIQTVDAMAVLEGWEHSTGAKAEVMLAQWRGIPIYEFVDRLNGSCLNTLPIGKLVVLKYSDIHDINRVMHSLKEHLKPVEHLLFSKS